MATVLPMSTPTEDRLPGDSRKDKGSIVNKAFMGKGGNVSSRPRGLNMNTLSGAGHISSVQKARRKRK